MRHQEQSESTPLCGNTAIVPRENTASCFFRFLVSLDCCARSKLAAAMGISLCYGVRLSTESGITQKEHVSKRPAKASGTVKAPRLAPAPTSITKSQTLKSEVAKPFDRDYKDACGVWKPLCFSHLDPCRHVDTCPPSSREAWRFHSSRCRYSKFGVVARLSWLCSVQPDCRAW